MRSLFPGLVVYLIALTASLSAAVSPLEQAATSPEAAQVAEGWALLAKGDAGGAAGIASQELLRNPYSLAALALAVDAEIARGGPSAALTAYERWLGNKRVDDPYALRRIARVVLVEATGKQPSVLARLEALKALAADGDAAAAASLELASSSNAFGETRALAALGNEQAVTRLLAQLDAMPGSKALIIDALGESGSKLPVPQLKALLTDPNDVNRAAAAAALGRLGATDAIPQIKPLLNEKMVSVKLKAAGALFRLNDPSGQAFLAELTSSEHSAIRVAAARELSPQPDAAWQALVRSLTSDPDPTVRLEAARLIAPYDQPLAKSVLEALMRDDNIGLREAASGVLVDQVATDFATLRALLRSGDIGIRVKAGARILELTR